MLQQASTGQVCRHESTTGTVEGTSLAKLGLEGCCVCHPHSACLRRLLSTSVLGAVAVNLGLVALLALRPVLRRRDFCADPATLAVPGGKMSAM